MTETNGAFVAFKIPEKLSNLDGTKKAIKATLKKYMPKETYSVVIKNESGSSTEEDLFILEERHLFFASALFYELRQRGLENNWLLKKAESATSNT